MSIDSTSPYKSTSKSNRVLFMKHKFTSDSVNLTFSLFSFSTFFFLSFFYLTRNSLVKKYNYTYISGAIKPIEYYQC